MLIDGIHVPLTTPFYRDGRSYLRKLEHNVGRYSLTPATGFVALPPGESEDLSDAEVVETLAAVSGFAAPEKVLIAGISRGSLHGALWLADEAAKAGFDALLVAPPVGALSDAEALLYFRAVADAAELPVMLYSDGDLSVEQVAELAGHANVIGLYDAALTVERFAAISAATSGVRRDVSVTTVFGAVTRRMKAPAAATGAATFVSAESLGGGTALAVAPPVAAVKTRTKAVGFQVMAAGASSGLVELLDAGVAGAMPRLAACAPQGVHEVYAAFKDGDRALSAEKAERLVAADALMEELGIAGIKFACDLNGYYGGMPRLPRMPLKVEDRERVEQVMGGLRN